MSKPHCSFGLGASGLKRQMPLCDGFFATFLAGAEWKWWEDMVNITHPKETFRWNNVENQRKKVEN